ncbi:MAG: TetR family transcriptional regulator C-terminal domain-containing protein [Halioglobus sp.]
MPKIVDHQEQRRQLCATVASVIAEEGLENTTLRTVAAYHGCTKGMVQHYFTDKEELLLGALAYVEDTCEQRMAKPARDESGLGELQARLIARLALTPDTVDEWQVRIAFTSRAAISPAMRRAFAKRQVEEQQVCVSALQRARKAGELRANLNIRNCYRSLDALVFGLGVEVVMNPDNLTAANQRQILKSAISDLRC